MGCYEVCAICKFIIKCTHKKTKYYNFKGGRKCCLKKIYLKIGYQSSHCFDNIALSE